MDYRRIWKKHYGDIPKDKNGWTYEIHHIDGNRENNSIENLICVSIEEHYNIHLIQGDIAEASAVASRMRKMKEGTVFETWVLAGSKWFHKGDRQRQMKVNDPRIIEEGWVQGMKPETVDKIRKTSHKAIKSPLKDPEARSKKVSESLKRAYEEGRRQKRKPYKNSKEK